MQQVKTEFKTYPAATQLATVTDLTPQEVKAVTEVVNPLIADAFALYTKTKNFHWHLYGHQFRDLHLLFDELAESTFESIDVMAERVRKIGGTTIRSVGHIAELQTIEDDNDNVVSPSEMVRRLLEDNDHVVRMLRQAITVCDKNRDSATSNSLQDILDKAERRKWFLYQLSQGSRDME